MNRTVRKGVFDEARKIYVVYPNTWELYCVLILPCVEYIFFLCLLYAANLVLTELLYFEPTYLYKTKYPRIGQVNMFTIWNLFKIEPIEGPGPVT